MIVAKQVADLFTYIRVLLAPTLVVLGIWRGEENLPIAIGLMIISWTSDSLDGPLARRSSKQYNTWIGDHDLEVDMWVSIGLLIYMVTAGFLNILVAVTYVLLWVLIFWRWGFQRSLGMLVQAPIYGYFLYLGLTIAPAAGAWMIGWILAALVITWPKFPKEIVPGFLGGMKSALRLGRKRDKV
ncbi:MAG: hypothetical protein GTO18_06005 [Anaerolineales bacterium]|nr:hypothetical protein [Anaerolineales bacterium]